MIKTRFLNMISSFLSWPNFRFKNEFAKPEVRFLTLPSIQHAKGNTCIFLDFNLLCNETCLYGDVFVFRFYTR